LPPPANPAPKTSSALGRLLAHTSAAAASAAGIMASMGGLFLFTVVGLIALWAFHPSPPTASAEETARVAAAIERADAPLWRCVPDAPATFTVAFNIHRGDVTEITVSPRSAPVADCLASATRQMHLSSIRGPLHVRLPVAFRRP